MSYYLISIMNCFYITYNFIIYYSWISTYNYYIRNKYKSKSTFNYFPQSIFIYSF
nr:MAG TPA: hypothetical protein [Siphoviridae sp. ctuCR5]DAO34002.1 MAG TPA: hypothetical protein [Bacteriophage sp.]